MARAADEALSYLTYATPCRQERWEAARGSEGQARQLRQ